MCSIENLKTSEEHGGFSLMNLKTQVHGRRSKRVYETITGDGLVDLQNKEGLQWLAICISMVLEIGEENEENLRWWHTNPNKTYTTFAWTSFLDGSFEYNFNMKYKEEFQEKLPRSQEVLEIFKRNPYIGIKDILLNLLPKTKIHKKFKNPNYYKFPFTLDIRTILRDPEIESILSWYEIFYNFIDHNSKAKELVIYTETETNLYNKFILDTKFGEETIIKNIKDMEGGEITNESFKGINKKYQKLKEEIITRNPSYPSGYNDENIEVTKMRYSKFWQMVKTNNKTKPGLIESLHRFNLGQIEHYFNIPIRCLGCNQQIETTLHTFERCSFTYKLWEELNFNKILPSPFKLKELTTPTETTMNIKILRNMSLWIDVLEDSRRTRKSAHDNKKTLTTEQLLNSSRYRLRVAKNRYGYGLYNSGIN